MTLRKKIGQLSVWKAGVLILLTFSLLIFGIEEIFMSRVFNLLDRGITHFEMVFKDDAKDIDRDYENFNEREIYDKAQSEINREYIEESVTETTQEYNCNIKKRINNLEKLLALPYAQNNKGAHDGTIKEIELNRKFLDKAIVKGNFDSSLCKDAV